MDGPRDGLTPARVFHPGFTASAVAHRLGLGARGPHLSRLIRHNPMSDPPSTPGTPGELPGRAVFVTTHWSAVIAAGGGDTPAAQAALEQLCRSYWAPLYAYLRRLGHQPEDAQDLTQAFFAHLLAGHVLTRADSQRGRFRSFLLASLKHFVAHEWERARAWKRGGHVRLVPLEVNTAETRCGPAIVSTDTPDNAFDRQWALAMLEVVLGRLRKEYSDSGREALFEGLKQTLAGERPELPYRDLGERLGLSEGAVKAAAHRLRQRYRELLREEIANTVSGPQEVEEELRQLSAALGG